MYKNSDFTIYLHFNLLLLLLNILVKATLAMS